MQSSLSRETPAWITLSHSCCCVSTMRMSDCSLPPRRYLTSTSESRSAFSKVLSKAKVGVLQLLCNQIIPADALCKLTPVSMPKPILRTS